MSWSAMRVLRRLSLKGKLVLVTTLISCVAVTLGCGAFAVYEHASWRESLAREFAILTELSGEQLGATVGRGDAAALEQALRAFRAHPQVVAVQVFDREGRRLARYVRDQHEGAELPGAKAASQQARPRRLDTFREIKDAGKPVGVIHVGADSGPLRERVWRYVALVAGLLVVCAGVAVWLATRLQRFISEPIAALAQTAAGIAANRNYSVRAKKETDDELGRLIDGFNELLAQIQYREAAVQRAHDQLEERVEERTRALVAEMAERRRTEEERDGFFTLSLDLLCITTLDGFFRRVNPAFREVLGYAPAELAGQAFMEFVHPEDREPVAVQLQRLLLGGTVSSFEIRLRHRDGSYRWIAWSAAPRPGKDYFYAYGRDVTALKQAEQERAREKARLQFIFESVAVGISLKITQPDGKHTRLINDAHLSICGLRLEQVREPGIFKRITHPDDYERQAPLNAQLASRQIDRFSLEKRYVHADGRVVWVSYSVQRHDYPDGSREELSTVVDITALKQAQEQGAREQARFKFIFDSVPVGICLDESGPDGVRERLLNEAHLSISGLTYDEARAGEFRRITHPQDYEHQRVLHEQLDRGVISRFSLEKRYLRRNGTVVWVNYSVQRRRYDDGTWQDLSTVVDITALKAAQEEVAAERARFKFIFDSVPVGISLLLPGNEEPSIANPAHERITGISNVALGQPRVFERASHPDDFVRQRPLVDAYKRGEIDHLTLEKRYIHPDGRVVWVSLERRMFVDRLGRKQSITTVIDITDLKNAQEQMARQQARFKFIFDLAPVGFAWSLEGDLNTRIVNPELARITGVPIDRCRELALYREATHPEDRPKQDELIRRLRAGEIDRYKMEKRYCHADGSVRWAVITVRMFNDVATGERQEITTLIDITERKQAEARLAETHRQLMETSRQAGMAEVATGVLHNVGNVLNSVNVSANILTDRVRQSRVEKVAKLSALLQEHAADLAGFFTRDPRGAQVASYLQTLATYLGREQVGMLAELESLRKNIEHIKDIVAMQQSYAKVSGVAESVPVVELVEDAVRMNADAIARSEITLERDFQANPTIVTEKHKVLQILVNLLRNAKHACEAANDRRITLRITAANARVKITVIDNGVGIARENLTRIFAHGFTTKKHGHGFGLHSGALAARELGGALTVQSDGPGRGAMFTLELPGERPRRAAGS